MYELLATLFCFPLILIKHFTFLLRIGTASQQQKYNIANNILMTIIIKYQKVSG